MNVDINKLFPQAARRAEILNELRQLWAGVVGGALARHSYPYSLGIDEISVLAEDKNAADMLSRMKGNIARALSLRCKYEIDGNFAVKIIMKVPKRIIMPKIKPAKIDFKIEDEIVKEYMKDAPETLPEDINYAVSHLQAFLEAKFKK